MNKTPFEESHNSDDKLLDEYHFNYKKAKPNRFAQTGTQGASQFCKYLRRGEAFRQ